MPRTLLPYTAPEHQPYYRHSGDRVAVLIHGFPGTASELRKVGDALFDSGWSVAGMLLPGFGPDFTSIVSYTHSDWLQAVVETSLPLRKTHETLMLVGNSMGSALAMQAATRVRPDALALYSPWWRINSRLLDVAFPPLSHVVPAIRPFRNASFADPVFRGQIADVLDGVDLDDPEVQAQVRALTLPLSVLREVHAAGHLGYRAAATVAAPTLVLQGASDMLAHPTVTRKLVQRLPNLAGYIEVASGHELAHMDTPTDRITLPLLLEFADAVSRRAQTSSE
jgi:esterase/lipase